MTDPKTVVVIGGGVAGLSVAEAIQHKSAGAIRPIVLEAESVPGGKITTQVRDGYVVESGPHGFLDKEPLAAELIRRLGLEARVIRADEGAAHRFIVRGGRLRLAPSSPPAFLFSGILPLLARLRVLLEPLMAVRAPEVKEESVYDFAARRIGRGAAEVLIDAMVTGIYGGDPKRLSIDAAFPSLPALEAKYRGLIRGQLALAKENKARGETGGTMGGPRGALNSFSGGLRELIDGLAARLELRTGQRIERLERTADGRFQLFGSGAPITADAVISTVPAFEAAALLRPHAEDAAATLAGINYAKVAVVVQGFEAASLGREVHGFGFLVPDRERLPILGSIWASSVFPHHAPKGQVMLRTLLGGARRPEHAEGSEQEVGERARRALVQLMGIREDARPVHQSVFRWDRAIPQYELGHARRVQAADEVERQLPGLFLGGNALRGVAMIQCIADGARMADRVVERLQRG